ncbi:(Lyso)-N-acylphosphatidylethanolamine lipase-like [Asterias amurensis]|uniref:(Lyso)-N-acylphosphatidylethanolamine lipase-like n=1 Tax=Asterias amurensis TaxID=7602 RepID=UPI003AB11F84
MFYRGLIKRTFCELRRCIFINNNLKNFGCRLRSTTMTTMSAPIAEGEVDSQQMVSSESYQDISNNNEESSAGWFSNRTWGRWSPTSAKLLQQAEESILSCIKTKYEGKFVPITSEDKLWTIKLNPSEASDKTPVVLVHGFASGVGLWSLNLDALSEKQPLYAFDMLGFGRSSRPKMPNDPELAEKEFVDAMEKWRSKVGIEKMVLVGHSLGGYLTYSYSIQHPERVQHLVLADPWGFSEKPPAEELRFPLWIRAIGAVATAFNPLSSIRAAGPWGPRLLKRARGDLSKKFIKLFDDDRICTYIYHCNAQQPSGEEAFKSMSQMLGWAVNPMVRRVEQLSKKVPVTAIYGEDSWMNRAGGEKLKDIRKDAYTKVHVLKEAGHHVYADRTTAFNGIIRDICDEVD